MKWLIASDIHGSSYYTKELLDAYSRESADRLILLGDILYHGPRNELPREYDPKAVIAMLNPLASEIVCVRGNCDGEVDDMVLDFPVLAEYALIADASIGGVIFAAHGHHFNPESMPKLKSGDILLYGHTHIPRFERIGGCYAVNPGSVSIPKAGSEHSYMIFENAEFILKAMDGRIIAANRIED